MSATLAALDLQRQPTVGVEDLVMLPTINDKAIVENLKTRFAKDLIYTSIGSVLISVNPFKRINQYGPERIDHYRRNGKTSTTPHIFGLAEETYRTMIQEEENQCVIISGESGAGKTEAAKQIMLYVAAVSGNSKEMARVKEIILESNPLLEAFGNAKTVRNDNSSRFGKFFEIYFDRVGGPIGGRMSNFLLEKSRVTRQQKGERNFHVFYQMCCGADDALRAKLKLRPPGEFAFLNQGKTLERAGVDDAKEWQETLEAMEKIGFSPEEKDGVLRLLAAILHLGEVKIVPNGDVAELTPEGKTSLEFVASLLEVNVDGLVKAFMSKKLEMGGETIMVKHDHQQAVNTRDALAKTIYDKIFNFVVGTVNRAFGQKKYALMLGVLDIYGFEIFEKNGFEQFCINYVNEKLQQIFIELTLKVEQEEYVREKIAWEEIKFFNNKVVCDLIEGKNPPGLFAIMDDVCAAMAKEKEHVADVKMVEKLSGVHGQHAHFKSVEGGFVVKHYAGEVRYSSAGFTSRNKDLLSGDLVGAIQETKNAFFLKLIDDVEVDTTAKQGQAKKKATTAGFKIRQQAADLVRTLMNCTPHYVRTIKSNDEKAPNLIDDSRVVHQCKYLGLLENIRVRRAGFAYRQYFDKFLKRFKYVSPKCFPRPFRGADKDAAKEVLKFADPKVPANMWQLGETKVFIRAPQNIFALEELREKTFGQVISRIQRAWIRYRNRREYVVLKRNMDKIYVKGGKERRSDSVFRPYQGEYLDYKRSLTELHPLVEYDPIAKAWTEHFADSGQKYYYNVLTQITQWAKPHEMEDQRIIYADKVERVFNHTQGQQRTEYMIVSDRAIYFIEHRKEMVVTEPTKPTKQNPRPPPPPEPYERTVYLLHKRIDLRLLKQLSVSKLADPYAVLHVYPPPVPYREVYMTPAKGETHCQWSQEKFTAKDKKGNCPSCGLLMKVAFLSETRPLPTLLGHSNPVAVCSNCLVGEPLEACEDVIISTPQKTEVIAMIRRLYKQVMGSKMPVTIDNNIQYELAGEKQPRTAVFQPGQERGESKLFVAPNQLVIHSQPGISQQKIAEIQRARDERAKKALEDHKKHLADEKVKEVEKEKEREEAHKKMVEERKRAKLQAAQKEEEERQAKEEQIRQQRERSKMKLASMAGN